MSRFLLCLLLVVAAGLFPALAFSEDGQQYPQRIVSLGPINTENVFLLGAGDRLVADTSYCVHPAAARDKVKIGSVMQLNIEQILSLHPDLILATGLTTPQQVAQLAASGVRVVHFRQPSDFAEICDQFLELGRLLGLENRAQEIIAEAHATIATETQSAKEQLVSLQKQKTSLDARESDIETTLATLNKEYDALTKQVKGKRDEYAAAEAKLAEMRDEHAKFLRNIGAAR